MVYAAKIGFFTHFTKKPTNKYSPPCIVRLLFMRIQVFLFSQKLEIYECLKGLLIKYI